MYLGLDLGTSGVKALLIDESQVVIGSTQSALTVSRPSDGWSEQNPADWITATTDAIHQLRDLHDLSSVKGIGLSGQMHGATLLDQDDKVLRPCMLWNDTRSYLQAAKMDADPRFRSITGNIVFPGFTAPKVAWVAEHEPRVFESTKKVLLPKDYLRLWLSGDYLSEMSDAAGTAWLDTGARTWSEPLLEFTGLDRQHMPDLVEGSQIAGQLRPALATELGLPANTPIAGGAGDNAASAVGVGVVRTGEAFVSLGTSGVLFAASENFAPAADSALHTFCHALPNQWHQMGVILAATDALDWFGQLVGEPPEKLTELAGPLQAPGRAMFLPYLGGERTPHNDARVRGALIGLEHITDRAAAARGVLEGVGFAFRDSLAAMHSCGTQPSQLIAVGGGSRADNWLQIIATTLDLPVAVPEAGDFGAAFGAARLGMMAATGSGVEIATALKISHIVEPNKAHSEAFADAYERYTRTYQALKELS